MPCTSGVGVEQVDAVADAAFGLGGVGVGFDAVDDDFDAGFASGLLLASDVGGGGGVVAGEDDGEVWDEAAGDHVVDLAGEGLSDVRGDGGAVDDVGGHGVRVCGHKRMGVVWGIAVEDSRILSTCREGMPWSRPRLRLRRLKSGLRRSRRRLIRSSCGCPRRGRRLRRRCWSCGS